METEKVLLTEEQIKSKVEEIAQDIFDDEGRDINLVVILKGAARFAEDLKKRLEALGANVNAYELWASSYSGAKSNGNVIVRKDVPLLNRKSVIVVEDIVDTGFSMQFISEHLKKKGAASVKVCTLLSKPARRKVPVKIDYLGFRIDDLFVVGYGLDYNEKGRDLPYIGVVSTSS